MFNYDNCNPITKDDAACKITAVIPWNIPSRQQHAEPLAESISLLVFNMYTPAKLSRYW